MQFFYESAFMLNWTTFPLSPHKTPSGSFFFKCLHTRKNNCSLKLYQATKWCVQLWYWSITIKPLCCWFVHYTFDYYNVQRSFETAIPLLPYMAWPYVKQLPLYVLIISKTDSRRYCIIVIRGRSRSTVNWKFFVAGFILKWTNYETNNLVQLVRPVVFCNTHSIDITYNSNVFFSFHLTGPKMLMNSSLALIQAVEFGIFHVLVYDQNKLSVSHVWHA